MTIVEAILTVMRETGRPMSAQEVFQAIESRRLYAFKAKHPTGVVQQQIRRHCVGVDSAASSKVRYFARAGNSSYVFLPRQN